MCLIIASEDKIYIHKIIGFFNLEETHISQKWGWAVWSDVPGHTASWYKILSHTLLMASQVFFLTLNVLHLFLDTSEWLLFANTLANRKSVWPNKPSDTQCISFRPFFIGRLYEKWNITVHQPFLTRKMSEGPARDRKWVKMNFSTWKERLCVPIMMMTRQVCDEWVLMVLITWAVILVNLKDAHHDPHPSPG